MILAIETATNVCSVAFENAAGELFEKRTDSHGSHSEKLFLFIKELMEDHQFKINDLEAVLVSEGPGSYTGLRIAASGVKGLLFGTDVQLFGLQTLATFACSAIESEPKTSRIHAIIDARREHVYHQLFVIENGVMEANGEVRTTPIASLEKKVQPKDIITGTGLERFDEHVIAKARCFGKEDISAQSLIKLFRRNEALNFTHKVTPEEFEPMYYTSNQV